MYDGYRAIAHAYDLLNADVDYERWSNFIETCFDRFLPARPEIVLDLACGTGRMTFPLADRGYDMIGIDGSADMLAEAFDKSAARNDRLYEAACRDLGLEPDAPDPDDDASEAAMALVNERSRCPLFLQQDMRDFELYGTVDAAICCLDSMNYLCGDGDLDACLSCIHLYLAPGGLLIFDVNTPYKFEHVYGDNAYILEDEFPADEGGSPSAGSDDDSASVGRSERSVFCGWQNAYDPESGLCRFYLSLFTESEDGRYVRSDEEQTERCYRYEELTAALDRAGFDLCGVFGDVDLSPVAPTTERWHFVARTRKKGDWYLCR